MQLSLSFYFGGIKMSETFKLMVGLICGVFIGNFLFMLYAIWKKRKVKARTISKKDE